MKKTLLLTLAAGLAVSGVVRADDAAPAATSPAAAAAAPAAAKAAPAADTSTAAAAPVAKNDSPGSVTKGNQLLDAGKYEEAAAYFTGIGEQSSTKREPYRLLGLSTALINLGKFDDAVTAAQKAVDMNSDLAAAWNNLASAQANSGKRQDAIATYDKAITTLKASKAKPDTSKLEANEAALKAAIEAGKPKKVKEAEAKAKAEADAAAAKAAAVSPTADAKADTSAAAK